MIQIRNYSHHSILYGYSTIEEIISAAKKREHRAVGLIDRHTAAGLYKFITQSQKAGIIPIPGAEIASEFGDLPIIAKNNQGLRSIYKLLKISYDNNAITEEDLKKHSDGILVLIDREELTPFTEVVPYNQVLTGHYTAEEKRSASSIPLWKCFYIHEDDRAAAEYHMAIGNRDKIVFTSSARGGKREVPPVDAFFPSISNFKNKFEKVDFSKIENHLGDFDFDLSYNPHLMPLYDKNLSDSEKRKVFEQKIVKGWAQKRKGTEYSAESKKRVTNELDTILGNDYLDYMLIVEDYVNWAKKNAGGVGLGRGSAAGSEISYLIGIHDTDPIEHDLLFERFLSPGRGSEYSVRINGVTEIVPQSNKYTLKEGGRKYAFQLEEGDTVLVDNEEKIVENVSLDHPSASAIDIDTDFHTVGRFDVMQYIRDKYTQECVANIITFSTYGLKDALRRVCSCKDIPPYMTDRLAKLIPDDIRTFEDFNAPAMVGTREEVDGFIRNDLKKWNKVGFEGEPSNMGILEIAEQLEGRVRGEGVHAAGMIISPSDLTDYVPVQYSNNGILTTQWEYEDCEAYGLTKFDLLGLDTVDLISGTIQLIEKNHGITLDPQEIIKNNLDDNATYEVFRNADTFGIFQYSSPGVQKFLIELQPQTFNDIMAVTALYRPGPMGMNAHHTFVEAKNNPKKRIPFGMKKLLGTKIDDVLKETYGLIPYQETIMALARECAGFSPFETDVLRKATAKKDATLLVELKPKLLKGLRENILKDDGKPILSDGDLNEIWTQIERFSQYSFNKSHATSYALNAFVAAYLRAHFPVEYQAVLISRKVGDKNFLSILIDDTNRSKIKISLPDINKSKAITTANKDEIILGFDAVKGMFREDVASIIQNRKDSGPYKGVVQMIERLAEVGVRKSSLETLAKCGALDSLGESRKAIVDNLADLMKSAEMNSEAKNQKSGNLFSMGLMSAKRTITLPKEDYSMIEKSMLEKEVFGLHLSSPLKKFKLDYDGLAYRPGFEQNILSDLNAETNEKRIFLTIVSEIKQMTTKKGKPMIWLELETYGGGAKALLDHNLTHDFISKEIEIFSNQIYIMEIKKHPYFDDAYYVTDISHQGKIVGNNQDTIEFSRLETLTEALRRKELEDATT